MAEYGEELTSRETEIIELVATGITNREVARELFISVNTVKVHLRNIYTKLGAESRTEATMIAMQNGWISIEGMEPAEEVATEGEATEKAETEPAGPPLPWGNRIALIGTVLLMAGAVALTSIAPIPTQADRPPSLPPEPEAGSANPAPSPSEEESQWTEQAQMPTRRAYLAAATAQQRLYAIGGQTPQGLSAAVEIYDPDEDLWLRGSDKPSPGRYLGAAAIGADVYVPGGCDAQGQPTATVEVYDTERDTWRQVSPLPEPRCAYAVAAAAGRLYLFGGWDGSRYTATAYVYDPEEDAWTEQIPMETVRGFVAATALEGTIYVVGGYDGQRELTTCAAYDPDAAAWSTCAPLTIGRGGLGLAAVGGQLYAIGGGGWSSYLGFNERYNPQQDTWHAVKTPLIEEWRSPGVTTLDTSIYAVGGWSQDFLSLNQAFSPLPFRIFIPVSQQQ